MNEIMRERIWRKLQVLPDEQLYQVLDYIDFIEHKYAPGRAPRPDGIQRFAERLEDSMRMRSVAPKVISGTVGAIGTARRMIRTVTDAGRELLDDITTPPAGPASATGRPEADRSARLDKVANGGPRLDPPRLAPPAPPKGYNAPSPIGRGDAES
jgi:hypothetical protein